ncbi:excisionase family DNA-binding protein [Shouchella clausii]|uniref:excisionase family DNA-binding protein n=1 Tax=Shouchella clausii TaxID=79880 RepID=UPI00280B1E25|nr:excisionase family DNA-binding protein [Shouchella clausii]WMM31376.1 excisionase family DNA-binding protein [Shouchella clausii]
MYISLQELASYLGVTQSYLMEQAHLGNIRGVYDGETWLFNKTQFEKLKEQLEKRHRQYMKEEEEPIPDDWDAHDED